ncbi:MAG: hypothetical protein GX427_03800 [Actinomycetales bacterium]|nr:hypothetical protein [Actinomycetales bacterium]
MSQKVPAPRTGRPPAAPSARRPGRAVLWRRRAVALLVVFALLGGAVWGVMWLVGYVRETVSSARAAEASATPTGPSTAQPVACDPAALEWALALDGGAAGSRVTFTLDVVNGSAVSCLVDAGPSLVLTVVSGEDRIWSNADCSGGEEVRLLLGPGDATQRAVVWNGQRSVPGCGAVDSPVLPGTYQVGLAYAGSEVAEASTVFVLN